MDKLAAGSTRKWIWIFGTAFAVVVLIVLTVGVPRIVAVYELYWGKGNIQRLFYEDLGLSESWSSFIAVVGSFFYALAWVPLSLWTYRVLAWRFNSRQLFFAFGCWVLVYGHVPLLHALLGSDACFNQRTGAPMKWYVEGPNGDITLYDSGGYDTVTRVEKRPVTSEICMTFARQKTNATPRKITANVSDIQFFDPNSGRARVWYSKAANGTYELFDSRGFNPATSEPLLPVTKEVVAEIMARVAKETEDRKRIEGVEAKKRAEAEQAQNRAAEAEAKRRAAEAKAAVAPAVTPPLCSGRVQKKMLTTVPDEINPGANCFMRWRQYVPDECLAIYDRWGKFLAEDCGGFIDLHGRGPAQFASSRKDKVEIVYVLCAQRGQTNQVADGCP